MQLLPTATSANQLQLLLPKITATFSPKQHIWRDQHSETNVVLTIETLDWHMRFSDNTRSPTHRAAIISFITSEKTTRAAMLYTLLEKLPLSQGGKVAFGTLLCLGICAIPVSRKTKAGHDLFSSEKPQDVYDDEVQRRREQLAEQYNQQQQK